MTRTICAIHVFLSQLIIMVQSYVNYSVSSESDN